jgi:hypothetical protein
MGSNEIIENGFLILKEDHISLHSPVSVLYYQYYDDVSLIHEKIESLNDEIQCVCGDGYLSFGKTQLPELDDYADGVNTLEFLSRI